jgi:hypothetical protein
MCLENDYFLFISFSVVETIHNTHESIPSQDNNMASSEALPNEHSTGVEIR